MAFEGIKRFFTKTFETCTSMDSNSTTHYYANDYNNVKEAVIVASKKLGYEVLNIDDKYKEILLAYKTKVEIIVTITTISYYENAVDMKINTKYFIPMGRTIKVADNVYNELNHLISLKRRGGVADEYNL